jgi:hypothetical protein
MTSPRLSALLALNPPRNVLATAVAADDPATARAAYQSPVDIVSGAAEGAAGLGGGRREPGGDASGAGHESGGRNASKWSRKRQGIVLCTRRVGRAKKPGKKLSNLDAGRTCRWEIAASLHASAGPAGPKSSRLTPLSAPSPG